VGPPFTSRRKQGSGLAFPRVTSWGTFICELCTVRAVIDRELHGSSDWKLLCFERMRVIDMAHFWATDTHSKYQAKIQAIRRFERIFGFQFLHPARLLRPPASPEIPLMWLHEAYSLRTSPRLSAEGQNLTLAMDTIRQLRSAASHYLTWEAMMTHPDQAFLDSSQRLLHVPCRATDGLAFTLFTKGMGARVGNETRPSVALLDRHIRFMDAALLRFFRHATSPHLRRKWALAGLANLVFWLGWLRSAETFHLRWCDFHIIRPEDGARHDLSPGLGAVLLRLQPETKSNRLATADVAIAYTTLSRLSLGAWFRRARLACLGSNPTVNNPLPVFSHTNGASWTSLFFRQTFLYPLLVSQQLQGDPYLLPFDGSPGNSIPEKFWSCHCYRRGAKTHVSRGGLHSGIRFKKATIIQEYEHARWRRKRSGERIDLQYQSWPLDERLKITLYCH